MGTILKLRDALAEVEQAETQLDELGAIERLYRLAAETREFAIDAALKNHLHREVAGVLGTSRQAVSKRRRPAA